jgi:hypothetical protein
VTSPRRGAVRLLGFSILGALLAGCLTSQPVLLKGDTTSAEIGYSGGDVASTLPIASQHCASYERVARLAESSPWVAYYACDRR